MVLDDYVVLEPLFALDQGEMTPWEVITTNKAGPLGRPVSMATFLANWQLAGGHLWFLKFTNLSLHLLCGTLVFWLTGRLLAEKAHGVGKARWWVALWVSAAWLLAPMYVSTVLYMVQRMAQLAALFGFAGLLLYVIGRQNLERRFALGAGLILLAFGVCWPLAVFSKENGLLFPLLALVLEGFFFTRPTGLPRRFLVGIFGVFLVLPGLLVLGFLAQHPDWFANGYSQREYTFHGRALSEPRILFDYVANLLLLPGGSPLGVYHDDYPLSRGLLSPPTTLAAILAWLTVLAVALWQRARSWGYVLAGVVFFLAGHLLESGPVALEPYFEHRNYLPGFGIFLSVATAAQRLVSGSRHWLVLTVLLALLPAVYGHAAFHRARIWQSWDLMLLTSSRTHPQSRRVHTGLASMYINRLEPDLALEQIEILETLYPPGERSGLTLHRLLVYCLTGREVPESAYAAMERLPTAADDVYTANAVKLLGEALAGGRCNGLELSRVADTLVRWLAADTGAENLRRRWILHFQTSRLLSRLGRPREAIEQLYEAWAGVPDNLVPGIYAFRLQWAIGDHLAAKETLALLQQRDTGRIKRQRMLIQEFAQRVEAAERRKRDQRSLQQETPHDTHRPRT